MQQSQESPSRMTGWWFAPILSLTDFRLKRILVLGPPLAAASARSESQSPLKLLLVVLLLAGGGRWAAGGDVASG
jgi:hypothetical protein